MNCTHANPCSDRDPETCKKYDCPANAGVHRSSPSACSAPTVAELIDHIQGMRCYYTGPLHQPSPRCVCRGCIDEKLSAWRKAQNDPHHRTECGKERIKL